MLRDDPDAPKKQKKVVFCIPTLTKPYPVTMDSLEASIPLIQGAGWDDHMVMEFGCPYISAARSKMLRKALDAGADVIVFIDHDLSWRPEDLLKLIETRGDVISGTYRFKRDEVEFMGSLLVEDDGRPKVREDGCVLAGSIPAGFLKITKEGVNKFMAAYPELCYGERYSPCVDLFNHGAHQWTWWGEDYAFARRWRERCGEVWIIPDLEITHWGGDKPFTGNFHEYLLACPGGSKDPQRES